MVIFYLIFLDIIALKEEITNQNAQITNLSNLENAQVTSEMKSIQIEEQLDQLETENSKLKEEISSLQTENKELFVKIDEVSKEKQELNTKLENYIQVSQVTLMWYVRLRSSHFRKTWI